MRPQVVIPFCCPTHRLAALDTIESLFANDAARTIEDLRLDGWNDDSIGSAMECYRMWIVGRITNAIEFGTDWANDQAA